MPDPDPLIGQRIGDYDVIEPIAEGGMGVVYRGVHPIIKKRVAIKVIKPLLDAKADHLDHLIAEAEAVNSIGHRNIVDIFGLGQLPDGRPYIIMELLEGQALDAHLAERQGPLPLAEAVEILCEICAPLSAAHKAGVIHRDLKPSNVFICHQADGTRYLKLLDFGLAKRAMGLDGLTEQTSQTSVAGTPDYMAPEQCRAKAISPRTDLYALGCIAYELLTGQLPFTGAVALDVMTAHVRSPAGHVTALVPAVPAELDQLVFRMMAKAPGDRPQSADEVREVLKRLLKQLDASPVGPPVLPLPLREVAGAPGVQLADAARSTEAAAPAADASPFQSSPATPPSAPAPGASVGAQPPSPTAPPPSASALRASVGAHPASPTAPPPGASAPRASVGAHPASPTAPPPSASASRASVGAQPPSPTAQSPSVAAPRGSAGMRASSPPEPPPAASVLRASARSPVASPAAPPPRASEPGGSVGMHPSGLAEPSPRESQPGGRVGMHPSGPAEPSPRASQPGGSVGMHPSSPAEPSPRASAPRAGASLRQSPTPQPRPSPSAGPGRSSPPAPHPGAGTDHASPASAQPTTGASSGGPPDSGPVAPRSSRVTPRSLPVASRALATPPSSPAAARSAATPPSSPAAPRTGPVGSEASAAVPVASAPSDDAAQSPGTAPTGDTVPSLAPARRPLGLWVALAVSAAVVAAGEWFLSRDAPAPVVVIEQPPAANPQPHQQAAALEPAPTPPRAPGPQPNAQSAAHEPAPPAPGPQPNSQAAAREPAPREPAPGTPAAAHEPAPREPAPGTPATAQAAPGAADDLAALPAAPGQPRRAEPHVPSEEQLRARLTSLEVRLKNAAPRGEDPDPSALQYLAKYRIQATMATTPQDRLKLARTLDQWEHLFLKR